MNICTYCSKEFSPSRSSKGLYCSSDCKAKHVHEACYNSWLAGTLNNVTPKTLRKFVLRCFDYACSGCGINEWMGRPITLDVEHIDGNSENNFKDNLTLLCPNCHSQTDTYKSKNIGKGRHFRKIRYAEGKSH